MNKKNTLRITEVILLVFMWMVLILAPVLFRNEDELVWRDFINPLKIVLPLFVLFLLNRFVLVPGLFFKKKLALYLLLVFGLIASFTFSFYLLDPLPDRMGDRLPREIRNRPMQTPPHLGPPDGQMPPPVQPAKGAPVPLYANFLIFSILVVGFDTGLMTSFRFAKAEKERAKLEKENAETQLAFLRNQVSPHFFMNTLNNIHALIDLDSEEAKESIIRLSKLMRHLLYDSEIANIPIRKEIEFIQNYVDLMKLRFSDKVQINLQLPAQLPDKSIPPLLFTSYLENAFKHGISYEQTSFIDIEFSSSDKTLTFEIANSNPGLVSEETSAGIGIENSRRRLDLIYGDSYELKIEDLKDQYRVHLNIPI